MRSVGCLPFIAFSRTATFAASSWMSDGSSSGSEDRRWANLRSQVENCIVPQVRDGGGPVVAENAPWRCRCRGTDSASGVVCRAARHVLRDM